MPHRAARNPKVLLNGVDVSSVYRVERIVRSKGGRPVDTAILAYDLGAAAERLIGGQVPTASTLEVQIFDQVGADPDPNVDVPLFWGKVTAQNLIVDQRVERVEVVARVERFHYGDQINGIPVLRPDAAAGDFTQYHRPIVFNPSIRGKIEPNKSDIFDPVDGFNYFLDPDSLRTTESRTLWGEAGSFWTLAEAAHFLIYYANPIEIHVLNPTFQTLESVLGTSSDLVKNLEIPAGVWLDEALDRLLSPYGYAWKLTPTWLGGRVFQKITVYEENGGSQKTASMQAPAAGVIVSAATDVESFNLRVDLSAVQNEIVGRTSHKQREVRLELTKTWPESLDNTAFENLELGTNFSKANPNVFRKWVANEAGDYIGVRAEIQTFFDFDQFFGTIPSSHTFPRRRAFLPNLAHDASGDGSPAGHGGVVVEWEQEPGSWVTIPPEPFQSDSDWGYEILTRECGIVFTGKFPPRELVEQGADAKIRITATVEADRQFQARATRQFTSPISEPSTFFLDLRRHYHDKTIDPSSLHPSGSGDEAADGSAMLAYLQGVRNRRDTARIIGELLLDGADHTSFEVGQTITQIAGRGIDLNLRSPFDALGPLYPEIAGIEIVYQPAQKTILRLTALSERLPEPQGEST